MASALTGLGMEWPWGRNTHLVRREIDLSEGVVIYRQQAVNSLELIPLVQSCSCASIATLDTPACISSTARCGSDAFAKSRQHHLQRRSPATFEWCQNPLLSWKLGLSETPIIF